MSPKGQLPIPVSTGEKPEASQCTAHAQGPRGSLASCPWKAEHLLWKLCLVWGSVPVKDTIDAHIHTAAERWLRLFFRHDRACGWRRQLPVSILERLVYIWLGLETLK